VVLDIEDEAVLSGMRVTMLETIAGSGGRVEIRWVVHAPDSKTIGFELVSTTAGRVRGTIELKSDDID